MPCTTILVGKKASYDGSTIIARNDDGAFETKHQVVVLPTKQKKNYQSVKGHLKIELPDNPLKYTMIPSVDLKNGFWPAAGINEANVSMTATETITSNPLVLGADPLVNYKKATKKEKEQIGGIGEEDLVCIVLPYIKSAREGVLRVGELLEKYGTYESNGMAFADENEIWWLETIGGHHYIAVRIPDDKVVIMPNRFGLDYFDFDDAYSKQVNSICSKDLKDFVINNHLVTPMDGHINPRLAFGSHSDQDHVYNTPRSWYLYNYFKKGDNKYTPISDDIPFMLTPDNLVTIQDVKYVLSSYYQNTIYNPYAKYQESGMYRSIGVPNSDDSAILQIRGYKEDKLKAVEWLSLGGSAFTASFPLYTNVTKFPDYISKGSKEVSTDDFYWHSRLIAALTDAHFSNNVIHTERYQSTVFNKGQELLNEYDKKVEESKDYKLLEEANEKLCKMLKEESSKTLGNVLAEASAHMKTKYYRQDN